MMIKTRFAPSPTGWLHIGGVRTALYSWLFAKKNNGKFYLRIDDTDTTRSTDEYKNSIISALTQLGLKHDDEITYQSNRFDHYIDKIEELLSKDIAYYDKVEVNEKTKETDLSVQYENRLNKEGHVIRFRNQKESSITISDSVHGEITFDPKVYFDVVILRSNGVPTYNLTSVVDDIDLGITHLIRGDDHLSNLPVQVNLFKSLNAKVPAFAHLPMIHGVDGKRLSKRHGAVDINHFLNEGYRVDAILNYLAKTGWSHGDQEIFSIEQLIELFDLDRITKSAAAFDIEKMNWLNQHYIKNDSIENIADQILPFLSNIQLPNEPKNDKYLKDILLLGIEREYSLKNIANSITYFYENEINYDLDVIAKFEKKQTIKILRDIIAKLFIVDFNDKPSISACVKATCKDLSLKFKDVGPLIRFSTTGRINAPSIDDLCFVLGKKRVIERISRFLEIYK
ncbi:glutamate--tRNA ligase [Gammaproteobacteria bacterium]|nr:glutamate--tRNA ligase [Gammaproteobacteria bacterium]